MNLGNKSATKFLKEIRKIGLKQKLIIILILGICFITGFIVPIIIQNQGNYSNSNPQRLKPQTKASLTISSNKSNFKVGETFTVTLSVNSFTQGVEAADFLIRFDPNYLILVSSSPGSFFPVYPIQQPENNYFKLSGMAKKLDKGFIIPKGKETVATLLFKAIKPVNDTIIEIDNSKTIIASEGVNILGQINNLKIRIDK